MKVTILQTDISWGNPLKNHGSIEKFLDGNAGADLYVLPEMFSTGFAEQPGSIAEPDGLSLNWMQTEARKRDCAIAGSVATEENGKYYNRFYFVFPDGSERHYDKHHLFTYGGEDKHFTAGHERVIVEYQGFRILLQVCYDLRFPVFSRNRKDYDMAIYVAAWPTIRLDAWTTLLHARAIENQCYVIGVNRTGDDLSCSYSGGSEIIGPRGNTIAECERNKAGAATAEVDMEALMTFRQQFPVLEDGDGTVSDKRVMGLFTKENFVNLAGAKLTMVSDGFARAVMEVREQHLNTYGICHGGALFTLADLAFAASVNKHSIDTLTTGANITYVKPALPGDMLTAEARELVNHHRMPFAEVKITNQIGETVAIFTASGYRKEARQV